jgi:hypothetical protein
MAAEGVSAAVQLEIADPQLPSLEQKQKIA